jgi:DNA invertase Pin-like site-specific DNA recombinase
MICRFPDQRQQLQSWCRAHGHAVTAEFVEAGTATDDRRPAFQQMIERACDGESAFDVTVVHSYSRFFREAFEQEFYLRKLAKHNVRVVSITQPVGDESEPVHAMMRKVIVLFDEYQSRENAKHVIRSMRENARQGFWNGATAPLGYGLVEAEKRGTKIKKRLAADPVEAECVRLIYKLYLYGDGTSGALGVKVVVKWLNRNGYRTRRGETFGVAAVHKILTNTVYMSIGHRGTLRDGARDRDPLLFAAGELGGKIAHPRFQPDQGERLVGTHWALGNLGDQRNVLIRGEAWHEIVELEHEPNMPASIVGEVSVVEAGQRQDPEEQPAARRMVEPAHDVEQGRLAAA